MFNEQGMNLSFSAYMVKLEMKASSGKKTSKSASAEVS